MNRRSLLRQATAAAVLPVVFGSLHLAAAQGNASAFRRARPSDPAWPDQRMWERLNRQVGGRLIKVETPLSVCRNAPDGASCGDLFKELKNPYYIGDNVALTQTAGWVDAWESQPSVYAVAAETASDVVAAVNFARDNNLRLVVKGGGHSYLGRSNAPDSFLIWTRRINAVALHDDFVAEGCAAQQPPQPAVSVGAGAIWMHTYNAVTTEGGRYVQGGGCGTVGVAGLVQAGGFGSFSKNFGTAAAGLLEAEIVTANGEVRIANACTNPDLFWGLKGGGGGSLGVVTRLTLKTHELPSFFGAVSATIHAFSETAFRELVGHFVDFYADNLLNPHWDQIVNIRPGNRLEIRMAFQDLDRQQAEALWQPFFHWVNGSPQDFTYQLTPRTIAVPARNLWDPVFLKTHFSSAVLSDDRPGAPNDNIFWSGNLAEVGHFISGYESLWLPASLLQPGRRGALADALLAAGKQWPVELHFQKGLAGGSEDAVSATKDTAMNPDVLDAFALAIIGGEDPPAFPGLPGHQPDLEADRKHARQIRKAMSELKRLAPGAGSYFAESDFFEPNWQTSYWGPNYPRLLSIKKKYDPGGLFFVHHGVGSEEWSADGFTRLTRG
ncbi:MAG: FAD-binding oxidoreductase [Alphaproteobacteria bacterium]|nr:FAD-binding oxidoreductase [Alphaproteobacteria bacterium]